MGFKTGWSFLEEWKASDADKERLSEMVRSIIAYWGVGKLARGKSLEEGCQAEGFGKPIAAAYKEWTRSCGAAFFQRTMLEIYCDNVDELLFKILLGPSWADLVPFWVPSWARKNSLRIGSRATGAKSMFVIKISLRIVS